MVVMMKSEGIARIRAVERNSAQVQRIARTAHLLGR